MLPHDVRVDRSGGQCEFSPEHVPQTSRVEHGPRANDARRRQSARLGRDAGHDVHGIGDDHEQPAQPGQPLGNAAHNRRVLTHQCKPGFARVTTPAGCDHDGIGLGHLLNRRGADTGCRIERRPLRKIQRLTFRQIALGVVNKQLGRDARVKGGDRHARSDPPHADDSDLHLSSARSLPQLGRREEIDPSAFGRVASDAVRNLIVMSRAAASIGAVAVITTLYVELLQVNPTTVALSYLVAILLIATWWGIAEAIAASLVAVACFNFFFLPPVGTWTIADPQNWVALVAFLLTAVVASQLSGRARQRNIEALGRQRDLERLYALSRALLLAEAGASVTGGIAHRIAETFELRAVALYDRQTDTISRAGALDLPQIEGKLRDVARQAVSVRDSSGLVITAIRLGGAPIGSLAILDRGLSDTVFQSIANLVAIGLERARGQEAAARAEAARQSGELRAAVLDALAHEFKTPLTSMKAAAVSLLSGTRAEAPDRELASIIDQDVDRLQVLVTDAVQMLRIDAGDFVVRRDRHRLAEVVRSTIRRLSPQLDGHPIVNAVPEDLSIEADRDLLGFALRQLIDNAAKYSPPTSTIEVGATTNGTVDLSVRNSGSAIPEREHARIFERFYRGTQARRIPGTGMGLAIVEQIARAHGGSVQVSSSPETGTEFRISLPRPMASSS